MNASLRILYMTQFFPPEVGAASVRAKELVENWTVEGHQVSVLTGFPSYLEGKIFPGYQNGIFRKEIKDGYTLTRVYTIASPKGAILRRVLGQIAFLFFSILGGTRLGRFDAVIISSPPFALGVAGWIIARLCRACFVFEVRDLYPETAVELGIIKNPFLITFLRWVESFYYRRADLIVAVTDGIRRHIRARGVPEQKIVMMTNGVNTVLFDFRPSSADLRRDWGLEGRFVVHYAGILGLAQGLDRVILAAEQLSMFPEIVFVLVGGGVEKPRLAAQAKAKGLKNVIFFDNQPLDRMPEIMSCADVGLALKKKLHLNKGALPVKMFEYMSCRRPVIVGGAEEAEVLVQKAEAGICIDPDDPSQLAAAVLFLYRDRARAVQCGSNGRVFVEKHYSRRQISKEYLRMLTKLNRGRKGLCDGNSSGDRQPKERP